MVSVGAHSYDLIHDPILEVMTSISISADSTLSDDGYEIWKQC